MTSVSMSSRSLRDLCRFVMKCEILQFGVNIFQDEAGYQSYKLCAERSRHYKVRVKKGERPQITFDLPCDSSCAGGREVEDPPIALLTALGIYTKVPANTVLVFDRAGSYSVVGAGQTISVAQMKRATHTLLNDQSVQVTRLLDTVIDLTPAAVRLSNDKRKLNPKLISSVVDTITNVGGKAVVKSHETELQLQAMEIDREVERAEQAELQRELAEKKRFGGEARNFLYQCGFSKDVVAYLMESVRPAAVRDAVAIARWLSKNPTRDIYEYEFGPSWDSGERRRQQRARKGAEYIVDTGGVPADKR